jgi:hypothetical protein
MRRTKPNEGALEVYLVSVCSVELQNGYEWSFKNGFWTFSWRDFQYLVRNSKLDSPEHETPGGGSMDVLQADYTILK